MLYHTTSIINDVMLRHGSLTPGHTCTIVRTYSHEPRIELLTIDIEN